MKQTWKVLIVDDDDDVHVITGLVFTDLAYQGRNIALINAIQPKRQEGSYLTILI